MISGYIYSGLKLRHKLAMLLIGRLVQNAVNIFLATEEKFVISVNRTTLLYFICFAFLRKNLLFV